MRSILAIIALAACTPEVNTAPQAVVDVVVQEDGSILLDARASVDPDGDALGFRWWVDHAPAANEDALVPGEDGTARLMGPTTGIWVIVVVADDGELESDPAMAVVDVGPFSTDYVADAGPDVEVALGQSAYVGGPSYSTVGGPLEFFWTLLEHPPESALSVGPISSATERYLSFDADVVGQYRLGLQVGRGEIRSVMDQVRVGVFERVNNAPVASASAPERVDQCTPVPLDCGASSDADGDLLFYLWQLQRAPLSYVPPDPLFEDEEASATTAELDTLGAFSFSCSVFDGLEWSRPSYADVEVVPRASNAIPEVDAGADVLQAIAGVRCTCPVAGQAWSEVCSCPPCTPPNARLAAMATDLDDDTHDFQWSVVSGPVRIRGADDQAEVEVAMRSILPTSPGLWFDQATLSVTATDCVGAAGTDEVSVRTTCEAIYP